ncbi:hypothetical protein NSQ61_15285 [Aeribacillus sp. FSL K6-1121]|uniref:hypothetical protein n=1 Tax=Aeribacillus TaxID=1055323 RepID=UPI0007B49A3C|nr:MULTISPECIES: hypothetical protein [Aeribacillus]KZM56337.1 hypothetical protein A3Q35_08630 [Aeribacillus pallidus]MED0650218.1 hypothetical protein [Aeribacillus composti]MED4485674.1 hypothetical protein [Aeribacillus pallidus]
MSDFLQERKIFFYCLIILLFLLIGVVYMYTVKPLKDDVALAQLDANQLEVEMKQLEAQLNKSKTDKEENTAQLEKKMPLSRNMDQLLLDLQEAEYVSGSQIQNISFQDEQTLSESELLSENNKTDTNDTNENKEQNESAEMESATNQSENENTDAPSNQSENQSASNESTEKEKYKNVKLITFNLSVVSPDFKHFLQFLQEIEKLERITRVDVLSFTKPGEKELLEDETNQTITMEIQLTTFYFDSTDKSHSSETNKESQNGKNSPEY